jgi:hypothetical protein
VRRRARDTYRRLVEGAELISLHLQSNKMPDDYDDDIYS